MRCLPSVGQWGPAAADAHKGLRSKSQNWRICNKEEHVLQLRQALFVPVHLSWLPHCLCSRRGLCPSSPLGPWPVAVVGVWWGLGAGQGLLDSGRPHEQSGRVGSPAECVGRSGSHLGPWGGEVGGGSWSFSYSYCHSRARLGAVLSSLPSLWRWVVSMTAFACILLSLWWPPALQHMPDTEGQPDPPGSSGSWEKSCSPTPSPRPAPSGQLLPSPASSAPKEFG